ncbi:hypothetical protein ACFSTC_19190 [Nonomuraea ferruginea]
MRARPSVRWSWAGSNTSAWRKAEALDLRLGDAAMADEYAALPVAVRAGDLEILRDDLVAKR